MDNANSLETPKKEVFPSFTCEICIEPMILEKKFRNKQRCSHPFCSDCIAKYIEAKVADNTIEVPCPALNCNKLLDPFSCRLVLPARLFEKWFDLLCESSVQRYCKIAYCPFPECSALIVNDCGRNITRSECPNCKKLFCFQCKIPWHAGFGCNETEQKRDKNDILFGNLVEKNKWKRCPGCKYHVERNEGCQNIKCRCGVLFCYNCGKIKNACDCYRSYVIVEGHDHMVSRRAVGADLDTRRRSGWAMVYDWVKSTLHLPALLHEEEKVMCNCSSSK
ncbi:hypothetical protein NE237_030392 [Protea cynaroides]|uniref:RBR-type E3 ubiquitin transferase n=1 Tax=Protea cynaroides TaxID=273540 RepID=A0A9Q0GW29_9MAGN|nr:hypothetical protein NE237_030392 [Protea cynaroides]